MKKLIMTIAIVSAMALTGVASAQSIVPTAVGTTSVTPGTPGPTGTGTTGQPSTDGTGGSQTGSSSVGVPNTGAGGDAAMNYAILAASALVAVGAAAYALRSRKKA